MHDRTYSLSETLPSNSEQRKYDRPQWVTKYLDLADTALKQKTEEPTGQGNHSRSLVFAVQS